MTLESQIEQSLIDILTVRKNQWTSEERPNDARCFSIDVSMDF